MNNMNNYYITYRYDSHTIPDRIYATSIKRFYIENMNDIHEIEDEIAHKMNVSCPIIVLSWQRFE